MDLRISSFNCRSLKSSITEVKELCDISDVCLLQETWLLNNELDVLNSISCDFYGRGVSAIDDTILSKGRPHGGIAILWRKALASSISYVDYNDPRIMGIRIETDKAKLLIICVYVPTDSYDNLDSFIDSLGKIRAILEESDIPNVMIGGDWNAHMSRNFGRELNNFCNDHNLCISDIERLSPDSYTYISDVHLTTSWLDHFVSSVNVNHAVQSVNIFL